MSKGVLNSKSYAFALDVIRFYKFLTSEKREFVLSRQLLRSGTAIGALIREAEHAQSRKDFLNKINISLKEANETEYWIDLLKDSELILLEEYADISQKIKEILRLLISTVKTTKQNLDR
ncbi:four helix bundle protein [Pedobacter sp. BS3]|uniref:four helix bundle protein n=1 Tax=Pedobacter sp. BS3 TaxID=2567937 RepID=UPI0011EDBC35|nr:four helix bundle protein [Pedobacter sp. BS3]TZF83084.1 four helix bundle protein [Pedobacter sp. BS3]